MPITELIDHLMESKNFSNEINKLTTDDINSLILHLLKNHFLLDFINVCDIPSTDIISSKFSEKTTNIKRPYNILQYKIICLLNIPVLKNLSIDNENYLLHYLITNSYLGNIKNIDFDIIISYLKNFLNSDIMENTNNFTLRFLLRYFLRKDTVEKYKYKIKVSNDSPTITFLRETPILAKLNNDQTISLLTLFYNEDIIKNSNQPSQALIFLDIFLKIPLLQTLDANNLYKLISHFFYNSFFESFGIDNMKSFLNIPILKNLSLNIKSKLLMYYIELAITEHEIKSNTVAIVKYLSAFFRAPLVQNLTQDEIKKLMKILLNNSTINNIFISSTNILIFIKNIDESIKKNFFNVKFNTGSDNTPTLAVNTQPLVVNTHLLSEIVINQPADFIPKNVQPISTDIHKTKNGCFNSCTCYEPTDIQ